MNSNASNGMIDSSVSSSQTPSIVTPANASQASSDDAHYPPGSRPSAFRTKPCRFYAKGKCTAGDQCRWSHDPAMMEELEQPEPSVKPGFKVVPASYRSRYTPISVFDASSHPILRLILPQLCLALDSKWDIASMGKTATSFIPLRPRAPTRLHLRLTLRSHSAHPHLSSSTRLTLRITPRPSLLSTLPPSETRSQGTQYRLQPFPHPLDPESFLPQSPMEVSTGACLLSGPPEPLPRD